MNAATHIQIDQLDKTFSVGSQAIIALQNVSLDIPRGQFVCLLGPSGCGKSTLLNAVGGFAPPSSGRVVVDGRTIDQPGPDRGMVFQEYALFPWMSVAQNIGFGLEVQGLPKADRDRRIDELLTMLRLGEFRDRYPRDLSGGMRQRVAIARVLAIDSPILLMDEPFGALDALTRRSLQDELLRLWSTLQKTVLFVTHSIEEAIYLADRIIVLTYRPGTIKQDIAVTIERPRDPSEAAFNALKRQLMESVMEEQHRHEQAERIALTGD